MPSGLTLDLSRFYLAYLAIMSIVTFVTYHRDKVNARKGRFRARERTLLGLSLAGGAFGGLPAMLIFNHKTRRPTFWVVQAAGIVIHTLLYLLVF